MMDKRAFTLIELVLSMSLVALLLLVALTSLHLGTRLWESGERTAERGWVKRYFAQAFQDTTASAYPYRSDDKILFNGKPERLEFVTAGRSLSGVPWGGASLIEYALEDNHLVMREKPLPPSDAGFARTTELSREVEEIRFSFLGSAGWEDVWDGALKDSLPLAIRASIVFKDGSGKSEFTAPVMMRTREAAAR